MSTDASAQQPKDDSGARGDAGVSGSLQVLLDEIIGAVQDHAQDSSEAESQREGLGGEGPFSSPASKAVLGEVATSAADLQGLVTRVRAQFQRLADLELRRILEMALTGTWPGDNSDPHPVQLTAPASSVKAGGNKRVHTAEAVADASEAAEAAPQTAESAPPAAAPAPEAAALAPEAVSPASNAAEGPEDDDRYEGTVRLMVLADGNMQRVVQFVDELCQKPQFRMLRMSGNPQQEGAEIALGLREPLAFRRVLSAMSNVLTVEGYEDLVEGAPATERAVTVRLTPAMNR